MRFLGLGSQVEELTVPRDAVQYADADLPIKAQNVLGTGERGRLSRKRTKENIAERRSASGKRNGEQEMMGTQLDTESAFVDSMLASRRNLTLWPSTQSANQYGGDHAQGPKGAQPRPSGGSTSVQVDQFYPEQQRSIESMRREYYDRSKQPLRVSQQTSASAARDMALHKGSPTIHQVSSTTTLPSKPLKSALKQPKPEQAAKRSETQKRPKKLDLASLFPQPRSSSNGRLLSPAKYSHSPSAMTEASEFFPQETVRAQVVRRGSSGRFETHRTLNATLPEEPAKPSINRVRIAEPDIFHNKKTNVRRPPKGIQNWFDGVEISSDEEEPAPVELPADTPPPFVEVLIRKPPSQDIRSHGQVNISIDSSARSTKDSLRVDEHSRGGRRSRAHSRASEASTAAGSAMTATTAGTSKRRGESRLTHSRLETESVLSLSSESADERPRLSPVRDSRIIMNEAQTSGLKRPAIPPRRLHSSQKLDQKAMYRQSTSTVHSSASIPIRIADDIAVPPMPDRSPKPDVAVSVDATTQRKRGGMADSVSQRSRRTTRSAPEREVQSAAGETVSDVLSDASRMMAVTEEEMMLLELMRQKRAAMQKDSFSEGYKLALKQEQEHLARRRESAHDTALQLLRKKEAIALAKSQRESMIESLVSEDVDTHDLALMVLKKRELAAARNKRHGGSGSGLNEEREQRRRYSAIRKADVDSGYKLGRFLSEDGHAPRASRMPQMERFLQMKPDLAEEVLGSRPVSGTEIDTSSMYGEDQDEQDEDDGSDEAVISPMQRLTDSVRHSSQTPSPMDDEGMIDEHHDKIRAFLASSSTSEAASAFPAPPRKAVPDERHGRRMAPLSVPSEDEKEFIPGIPDRSPHRRPPLSGLRTDSKEPSKSSPLRPSMPQPADFDTLIDTMPALPTRSNHPDTYGLAALDFAPLELPHPRTGSPSLSSRPSPLTPTFPVGSPTSDKTTVEIASSEDASPGDYAYSSEPDPSNGISSPQPVRPANVRVSRLSKMAKMPPRIDTTGGNVCDRVVSVSSVSVTSAGEDVLAAWANLGGGSDAYAAKRRGR